MRKQLTYWMLLMIALLIQLNIQAQNATPNFEVAIDEYTTVCQDNQAILHAQLFSYYGFKNVFAPENWSLTNDNSDGSVDTSNAPTSITLTGGNNGSFYSGTTDYSITIPVSGTLSFNWDYNSEDGPYYEYVQIIYDDETSYLTGFDLNTYPLQSGTMSIEVEAGKTFTIRMYTDDNYYDGATVVFSRFGIKTSSLGTPTYNWTASQGGNIYTSPNGLTGYPASVNDTYTYTITAQIGDVTSTDSITVSFYSAIEGVITEDSVFYSSDADYGIMTATPTGGTGPYTYLWSTGETDSTVYGKGVGTYSCTITDANGCSTTVEKELIFTEVRPVVFEVTGGGTNCYYDDIEIGLSGSEEEVVYYLYKNSSYQTSFYGTGSAMSFGNYYDAGIYSVEAHNLDYDTVVQMSGVAVINNPSYTVAIAQPAVGCVGGNVLLTSSIPYATGTMQSTSGFTGAFAPENWQHVNGDSVGTVNTDNAPTSIVITSDNSDAFNPGNTYYSITMPISGLLSFNWTLNSPTDPSAHKPMVSHVDQTHMFTGLSAFQENIQSGVFYLQVVAGELLTLRLETIGQNHDIAALTISNFTVTTDGVGTPSYLWTASDGGVIDGPTNEPTANAAAPGIYTLTVTELGCSFSEYTYVDYSSPVTANIELIDHLTSPLAEDGKLTVLGEGGYGPFTYAWNTGATTATISGIGAGTYSCTISSVDGCEAYAEFEFIYNVINPATYEVTGGGSICDGGPAIPVGLSGSEVGVTYQLRWEGSNIGSVVEGTGSAISFGNFSEAGYYSVDATSTYSQYSTEMYNYVQIKKPMYIVTIDEPAYTCSDFYEYIYISSYVEDLAYTGNPTYLWTASNGGVIYGATNSPNDVGATASGTYTLTVTEDGCSYSNSIDLIISTPIVPVMTVGAELTGYYAEDGELTVSATGGTPPYSYYWNTGATTPTITAVGEGYYSCYVTDVNGCYSTNAVEKYLTYIPVAPEAYEVTGGGNICAGVTGIEIGLSGSQEGVFYQLELGSSIISGVLGTGSEISLGEVAESGTYIITALDFTSNLTSTMLGSAVATVTDFTIAIEQPDVKCAGEINILTGSIAIASSGGGGTPTYSWTASNGGVIDGATNGITANATTDGTYTLTASLDGCTTSSSVVVSYYSPTINIEPQSAPACIGNTEYLYAYANYQSGVEYGAPVFSWTASDGGVIVGATDTANTAVSTAGTYTLSLTSGGCTTSSSVVVSYYSPLVVDIEVSTPLSSSFANDGALTATVSGGTPPYYYSWDFGTGYDTATSSNLYSGTYNCYVYDANGCYGTAQKELGYDFVPYEVTGGGIYCEGGNGVAVGLSNSEEGVPYQVQLESTNVGSAVYGTGSALSMGNFSEAGTYTVVALNSIGEPDVTMTGNAVIKTINYTVAIEEPAAICSNEPTVLTGSVTYVSGLAENTSGFTGAFAPENWTFSNQFADGFINTDNAPTFIVITGGDDAGNEIGTTNYSITIPVSGTLSFDWNYDTDDGATYDYPQTDYDGVVSLFTGYDANGMPEQSGSVSMQVEAGKTLVLIMHTTDNLFGAATVTISNFDVVSLGGTPSYAWTASNGGVLTGATDELTANATTEGTYTLMATVDGCTFSENYELIYSNPIEASINIDAAPTTVSSIDGELTVSATGGTAPYTYLWNTGATTPTIVSLSAGMYSCIVSDANGCSVSIEKELAPPAPLAFQVSGGGWICLSDDADAVTVNLSNSEVGVSYQLKLDGNDIGTAVVGTGTPISFGNFSAPGKYTAEATHAFHGTTTTMTSYTTIKFRSIILDIEVPEISCTDSYVTIKPVEGTITGFKNGLAPENWTLSTDNTNVDVLYQLDNTQLVISRNSASSSGPGSIDYTITLPYSGNFSFDWFFNSNDQPGNDYPQLIYDGNPISFEGFDSEVSGQQEGWLWVDVEAGATLTIRMFTQNMSGGNTELIINDFKMMPFLSGTPTYSWTASNGGTIYGPSTGTADGSINAAVEGTYTLTASVNGCSFSKEVVVEYVESPSDVTIWNGTEWSNGTPHLESSVIIDGDLVVNTALDACKVVITENGSLTISADAVAFVMRNFDNNATATDFVVENEGTILQFYDTQNVGPATVNVNSFPLYRQDYTLWSSPVKEQNLRSFSPQTLYNRFNSYNPNLGSVGAYVQEIFTTQDVLTKEFAPANGYLIRMPNNWTEYVDDATPGVSYAGVFTGVPQNGTITVPLSTVNAGMNLVGNPYPSPININSLFANNPNIDQTIYYWRMRNGAGGSGYATYNAMGFVSAQPGLSGIADALDAQPYISTGQGFFVKSAGANALNFNNNQRTNTANGVFLREETTELHRFRLNLSTNDVVVGQTLIGYANGATAGIDNGFDSSYFNDSTTAITSLINGDEFIIQGLGLPFVVTSTVPLGFKTSTAGMFTISLDAFDGLFVENQDIYIKDDLTETVHNVKESAYSFTTVEGIFNSRFEVVYQSTLSTDNPNFDGTKVMVYKQDNAILINTIDAVMQKVELYDVRGSLIQVLNDVNQTTARFSHLNIANQVVLVKITTVDNTVITKKIVF